MNDDRLGSYGEGFGVNLRGDGVEVELRYPRSTHHIVKAVYVGLSDVRAADDIRITYDFDRDGWRIEQASVFSWACEDPICDPGWAEVAFVKAWASAKKGELE